MKKIILLGSPRTTNTLYATMCRGNFPTRFMSKEGKSTKDSYILQTRSQWSNKPLIGDVIVHIELYFGTKRKCDIDNFNKILLDSMTGIVWEDDSQIVDMRIIKRYDKENPRIEITIL